MKKKRPEGTDVEEVRRAEMNRGRRPIDLETRRQRENQLRELRDLIDFGTEEELVAVMRAFGLADDSERFQKALQIWRERGL